MRCKTESSAYGIFVSGGRVTSSVFVDERSLNANAPESMKLDVGRWHHVALAFDGQQASL